MNPTCDEVRRDILDWGWGSARRRQIAACLAHLESCPTCQAVVGDYDTLQARFQEDPQLDAEPPAGWGAFEDRLVRQITSVHRRSPIRWMPMAMAASLVLGALGWGMYWGGQRAPHSPDFAAAPVKPSTPLPTRSEVSEGVRLFGQVASVFDHRANWVLVGGDASDVGLSSGEASPADQLMFVRLVLSAGGRTLSTTELVIVPGRTADLKLPTPSGRTVEYHLRTLADDPSRVQISATVWDADHSGMPASLATQVTAAPGQSVHVGELRTATDTLRLDLAVQPARASGRPA